MTQIDLEAIRGDDTTFDVVIRDSSGQTVNLTGGTLKFTARDSARDDALVVIEKTSATAGEIDFTDPIHGMAALKLVPADTGALYTPVALVYDFEFTAAGSGDVTTVLPAGILYVLRDITHA